MRGCEILAVHFDSKYAERSKNRYLKQSENSQYFWWIPDYGGGTGSDLLRWLED